YHSSVVARDTLIDFFSDLSLARGPFLVYDDGFRSHGYSYPEVVRAAHAFAAHLHESGVRQGDKIVFWSENRPEWIVAFWGCLLRGIIVVPIDYRASPDFLARVVRLVAAKLVLIGQDVPQFTAAIDPPVWKLHEFTWPPAAAPPPADLPPVPIGRDDVAEIIFTSGATADPKGVVITHRNVLANIVPVEHEVLKYRKWGRPFFPLRFLNLLPLSHMFGQAMATFIPPMLPGVVVFMRGYNPGEVVEQIRKRRISVVVSVPKILDVLKDHVTRSFGGEVEDVARRLQPSGKKEHFTLRWWRYRRIHRAFGMKFWAFIVGAAPLDPPLEGFWSELGFVVIQGYGLTETAPIVTLNHPFGTKKGSVGKAIAGVEMKIAPDGEILVRGENVTRGYFNASEETAQAFEDGWFRTGDIGEIGEDRQLYIRGRKKEMIVTPEGLNVFPEDVERVVNQIAGVREAAVVGVPIGSEERVHAVIVLEKSGASTDPESVARQANAVLDDHQKIRRVVVWPESELPRTEGTGKLKRAAIRDWVKSGGTAPHPVAAGGDALAALVARYAGRSDLSPQTTLEELGLSSLERVELMVALEDAFETRIDEASFAEARDMGQLRALVERASSSDAPPAEPVDFPAWSRSWWARAFRRVHLPVWVLPMTRAFAWMRIDGREHLRDVEGPVIFASNHQSFMDGPVIMAALPARWRYRLAPAMGKEMFAAHFFPAEHGRLAWFTNSLNYYLAVLFFNAFPLPQREAGARQTLRYIGELLAGGISVLIFPEGRRAMTGDIDTFRPGIGMIAARLGAPVVPVRLEGVNDVLRVGWRMARPGRVRVAFGAPIRLAGDDYEALAKQVEAAVRAL
ncbi:MAG: long-chain acyl-CoA synthetase, partial [Acidobacteriota bacterium]|nr:long-chain acyl-CoA synthetase [Acidobacteriota bacterium]